MGKYTTHCEERSIKDLPPHWQQKRGHVFGVTPCFYAGSPNGTRTRVAGVRGQYPRPLDDGTF